MNRLALIAIAALASIASAQGVLERLEGDFTVMARAVNERGAVFLEIDVTPANIKEAVEAGVLEEESRRIAIFTPDEMVRYAMVMDGRVYYYESNWIEFVHNNRAFFSTENLTFEGDTGNYLNAEAIEAARNTPLVRDASTARRPQAPSPRNGCVSNSTSTGSTMTCYTNGRVTFRSVCTVNQVTYAISCRSETY